MAHIQVPEGAPGILGPMAVNREMIATYVSAQNDCNFCQNAHGAVATYRLNGNEQLVDSVKANFEAASISEKLKALLAIAGKVQQGGKQVTNENILRARQQGATDKEIHDTVLIAAAFCMYNRYVDGLATWAPTDANLYRENGRRLAEEGYIQSTAHLPVAE
jgi:uncharacterized peroxidase-related enzyme